MMKWIKMFTISGYILKTRLKATGSICGTITLSTRSLILKSDIRSTEDKVNVQSFSSMFKNCPKCKGVQSLTHRMLSIAIMHATLLSDTI